VDPIFQFVVTKVLWPVLVAMSSLAHASSVTGCNITVYAEPGTPALSRVTEEDLCGMSIVAFTSSGHFMKKTEVWLVSFDKESTSRVPQLDELFTEMFGVNSEHREELMSMWYGNGIIQISPRAFSYDTIEVPMLHVFKSDVRAYETLFGLGVIASAVLSDHAYRSGTPLEDVPCMAMLRIGAPWQKFMWNTGIAQGVTSPNTLNIIARTWNAYANPDTIGQCIPDLQTSQSN
jgi:hypothetical protein